MVSRHEADRHISRLGPRKWAYNGTVYDTRKEARAAWRYEADKQVRATWYRKRYP